MFVGKHDAPKSRVESVCQCPLPFEMNSMRFIWRAASWSNAFLAKLQDLFVDFWLCDSCSGPYASCISSCHQMHGTDVRLFHQLWKGFQGFDIKSKCRWISCPFSLTLNWTFNKVIWPWLANIVYSQSPEDWEGFAEPPLSRAHSSKGLLLMCTA